MYQKNKECTRSYVTGIKILLFLVVLVSILPCPVTSFTLSYQDEYGSTSKPWERGTFTDKVIFESSDAFSINLSNIQSDEYMICVEWNDQENEGGDSGTFEGDRCWVDEDIFGDPEEVGCLSYMLDVLDITTVERDYDLDTLDFLMDDDNPYSITTWFRSYYCPDNSAENVTLEDSETIIWYTIDRRKHDCDGSRSNDFYLRGYYINTGSNRRWVDMYEEDCIDMVSSYRGFTYATDVDPLSLSTGEVRCDEEEDDNEVTDGTSAIYANQQGTNDHPCTINLGVDVGLRSRIDDDECQSNTCNDDNICGSCAITIDSIDSEPTDDDTDDNYILQIGDRFGALPDITQSNSDEGPDCTVYDTDGNGLYDTCHGRNNYSCITKIQEGPQVCYTGAIEDFDKVMNITAIDGTITAKAISIDDSCNEESDEYYFNVTGKDISFTHSFDYTGKSDNLQFRQDTTTVSVELEADEDFNNYYCRINTTGDGVRTSDNDGSYDSGTEYLCTINTESYFTNTSSVGDEVQMYLKVSIDADVYDEFDIITDYDSRTVYEIPYPESNVGDLPILNYGVDFNPNFPALCEFGIQCWVNDNSSISQTSSWYNYFFSTLYADKIRRVRTRWINADTGYVFKTEYDTISSLDTNTSYAIYSWLHMDSYEFPFDLSGAYTGNIQICYEFWHDLNDWICIDKNIPAVIPVNTLITVLNVYNGTEEVSEVYDHVKYESLKFCANKSYVGLNNTNTRFLLDWDGDGVIDYDVSWSNCITKYYDSDESSILYTAQAKLQSDERIDDGVYQFQYRVYGVCNDSVDDWNEDGIDDPNAMVGWSEECWGTCYDDIKNANEEQIDYKGRCGNCAEGVLKGDDIDWLLLHETGYLYYPFNQTQCIKVQGTSGTFLFVTIAILFFSIFVMVIMLLASIFGVLLLFGVRIVPFSKKKTKKI